MRVKSVIVNIFIKKLDEFIIVFVLYFKLISLDMTSVETFILKIFDNYIELSNKRIILLKYLQLLIAKIVTIDKFKVLLEEKISKVKFFIYRTRIIIRISLYLWEFKLLFMIQNIWIFGENHQKTKNPC